MAVLDNFEDLCPDGPAKGVQELLAGMSEHAQIIVTKRGRPDLRLARSRSFPIRRLDPATARTAFLGYVEMSGEHVDEGPALDSLLDRLDGYPLAISLVARAIGPGTGPAEVLAQYDEGRADLLNYGDGDDRTNSLAASVRLSLETTLMQDVEGARETCFVLAHLPDGVHRDLLRDAVFGGSAPEGRARSKRRSVQAALTRSGLASYSAHPDLLRMVVPLREHFRDGTDLDPATRKRALDAARNYLCQLLKTGSVGLGTPKAAQNDQQQVLLQLGNIDTLLARDLQSSSLSAVESALRMTASLCEFSIGTSHFIPAVAWRAIEIARRHQLDVVDVTCGRLLGDLLYRRGDLEGSSCVLTEALNASRLGRHRRDEAQCLRGLSYIAVSRSQRQTAIALKQQALEVCRSIGDRRGEGTSLYDLAEVALLDSGPDASISLANEALAILRSVGDQAGEAWCLLALANAARRTTDLDAAIALANEGAKIFSNIGNRQGEAATLRLLAEATLSTCDLVAAERHADSAMAISWDLGHPLGQAKAHQILGKIALAGEAPDFADEHLAKALDFWTSTGRRDWMAEAHTLLADVASRRQDLVMEREHLAEAHRLYEELGNLEKEAAVQKRLDSLGVKVTIIGILVDIVR